MIGSRVLPNNVFTLAKKFFENMLYVKPCSINNDEYLVPNYKESDFQSKGIVDDCQDPECPQASRTLHCNKLASFALSDLNQNVWALKHDV